MRNPVRLLLLLTLLLTSIGLGTARGTVQIAGQVVICTGEGVVIRNIPGAPSNKVTHVCPDMALSLLNSISVDFDLPEPEYRRSQLSPQIAAVALHPNDGPETAARDPPKV